jgi:hypothetical protein
MNGHQDLRLLNPRRPEPGNAGPVPDDAQFILAFEADELGLAEYEETLYLRRTPESDELWSAGVLYYGLSDLRARGGRLSAHNLRTHLPDSMWQSKVAEARKVGTVKDAAVFLMQAYVAAVSGFSSVNATTAAGILGARELEQCLAGIGRARQRRKAAAQLRAERLPTIMVAALRELGLNPEPADRGADLWRASCPGTKHSLMINAKLGEFGCGYCNTSGGVAELRTFVEARRARVTR